jgi:hypothetical protein
VAVFTIVVIGLAILVRQLSAPREDITGAVSKVEPPVKQDGTPAHPYVDDSQCPPTTDLVIWPKDNHPIPASLPAYRSVLSAITRSAIMVRFS